MAINLSIEDIKANPDNLFRPQARYKARVVEDPMMGSLVEVYDAEQPGIAPFRGNIEAFNRLYEDSGIV